MYKILLVTDRPEILDAFQAVSSWESLGFRVPRICNSAEGAIACLKAHHVDGIGIRLDMEQEALLMGHLTAFYPILPIFAVSENAGELVESITELRSLLNRTHADFSNDNFGEADMLQVCRHEFFRDLLSERITGKKYVLNHMRLLRSRMDPQAACVMVDLSLPTGEEYLAGRWHYGPESLEVALRNFFGAELQVCVSWWLWWRRTMFGCCAAPCWAHKARRATPLPGWLMCIPWRSSTRHVCIWTLSFS